jgi:EAL domain-containing protein (putative c-di-GMP-specific phosphodiesterase class I)
MDVVVEGVETTEQLMVFRRLQCEYVQGHLLSKALDRREIEALLEGNVSGESVFLNEETLNVDTEVADVEL